MAKKRKEETRVPGPMVRCTAKERQTMEAVAEHYNMDMANMIRFLVDKEYKRIQLEKKLENI